MQTTDEPQESPDRPVADGKVDALLGRAFELARSDLSGINEAATELAEMSGDDAEAISAARRVILERLREHPDPETRQVYWLIRRGIELGAGRWPWRDTGPVP